jgi:hypothetical protein
MDLGRGTIRYRGSGSARDEPSPNLARRIQLAARVRARSSDRVSRTVIVGSFRLEQRQHSFSAVRGPRRDEATLVFAERLR